jgi:hypothetical protein
MLTAAYHMFKDGTLYEDLGADQFGRRAKGAQTKRPTKLHSLGYDVQITPLTPRRAIRFFLEERTMQWDMKEGEIRGIAFDFR